MGQAALLVSMVCQSAFLAQVRWDVHLLIGPPFQPLTSHPFHTQSTLGLPHPHILHAQQDPVAPSMVGLASTLVAVAGHAVLVGQAGLGLVGAALATTAGNLAGAAALILGLHIRGKVGGTAAEGLLCHNTPPPILPWCSPLKIRGFVLPIRCGIPPALRIHLFLHRLCPHAPLLFFPHPQLRPIFSFPQLDDVRALGKTMAPLSVTYIAKNCCYIVIQVRSVMCDPGRQALSLPPPLLWHPSGISPIWVCIRVSMIRRLLGPWLHSCQLSLAPVPSPSLCRQRQPLSSM